MQQPPPPYPVDLEPDEQLIVSGLGENREFWLTSERLVQRRRTSVLRRAPELVSLPLGQIDYAAFGFLRRTWLLVAGVGLVAIGAILGALAPGLWSYGLWIAGVVVVAAFVVTGRRALTVYGYGRRNHIKLATGGLTSQEMSAFIDTLEDARAELLGLEPEASNTKIADRPDESSKDS